MNSILTGGTQLVDIFGTPHVGLFLVISERYCIAPRGLTDKKLALIGESLGVEVCTASVASSHILGPLIAMNSNGVLLPSTTLVEEFENIKRSLKDIRVEKLPSRLTALGNLIAANDKGAIVSPEFSQKEAAVISDTLGVEVVKAAIANRPYVGSICILTNKGGLIHIEASEEDMKLVEQTCGVAPMHGTVNDGVRFVKSGLVANSKGALIGARTNGPELMTISRALGL